MLIYYIHYTIGGELVDTSTRLKHLYQLLQAIREHKLGLDWESKTQYKEIEEKIIAEIKSISVYTSVVK